MMARRFSISARLQLGSVRCQLRTPNRPELVHRHFSAVISLHLRQAKHVRSISFKPGSHDLAAVALIVAFIATDYDSRFLIADRQSMLVSWIAGQSSTE